MDSNNPYVTVGAPNYAGPILDWAKMLGQKPDQQQQQRPQGQAQGQQPNFLQQLIARFGPQLGIGSSPTMSGNPGGLFSGVQGAPGYYGGSPDNNPMLRPMG